MTELITIRPEDIGRGKATIYSDLIINRMMRVEELEVVGISNAISLACSAVVMSSSVARIYIKEACLDYIEVPILGKMSAIFFTLGGEPTIDWESEKAKLEKDMKLDFERDGQLIIISKNLPTEKTIPLCLWKLSKSNLIKITATGFWINRAATLALEIAKGKISKEPIAIELIILSSMKIGMPSQTPKLTTLLEIFLKKGEATRYSGRHRAVLSELIKSGR